MRRHERPHAVQSLAPESHRQPAVWLLLEELVGPSIPDLDGSCAVLAGWDRPFEVAVLERMVLDVDG